MNNAALLILVAQQRLAPDPLWLQIGQAFNTWATPILIALGGLFAYYRFRRSRAFRRRLKVEVSGRVERATGLEGPGGTIYLLATVVVTNIGDSAVDVDGDLLTVEALEVPGDGSPPWEASWADVWGPSGVKLGLPKLSGGRTLEPGEPVEERRFLGLPDSGYGAIRVTARVGSEAAGKAWENDEVVVITAVSADNGGAGFPVGGAKLDDEGSRP